MSENIFANLQETPPDPLFGLVAEYNKDAAEDKVNLIVGAFHNEAGVIPLLDSVHQAEQKLLSYKANKNYLGILGDNGYIDAIQKLVFGEDHPFVKDKALVCAQTPGGTGSLRAAGDLLFKANPNATVWLSNPTWANHKNIFPGAGLKIANYRYYNSQNHTLDFAGMLEDLHQAKAGDMVLLHGCCHNPTGMDLDQSQWEAVGNLAVEKDLLVLIDFAYQGFAEGIEEDRLGINVLSKMPLDLMVASSGSKNFSLYNQRIGALSIFVQDENLRSKVKGNLSSIIRRNYSNPPAHGAHIVSQILNDHRLHELWLSELKGMRDRMKAMRKYFDEVFSTEGIEGYEHVIKQNGMFSLLPLSKEQVLKLRQEHHIYLVNSGRINVSALNNARIEKLADLIKNKI